MPQGDPIKDLFNATKATGLFLDEQDFRDQLTKSPKEVFGIVSKGKGTTGLFLDYDDFENSLGLKKKVGGLGSQNGSSPTGTGKEESLLDKIIRESNSGSTKKQMPLVTNPNIPVTTKRKDANVIDDDEINAKATQHLNDLDPNDSDPLKTIKQKKTGFVNDKLATSKAVDIALKNIVPDGFEAKKILATPEITNDQTNETKRLVTGEAERTAKRYDEVADLVKDVNGMYAKQKFNQAAIKQYAKENPSFAKELQTKGLDLNDIFIGDKISSFKVGQAVESFLGNHDLQTYATKEKPELQPLINDVAENLLTDQPEYGINRVANKVSQARLKEVGNHLADWTESKTDYDLTNSIAESVLSPKEKQVYDTYIRNNQDKYLDKPSILAALGGSIKDTFKGIGEWANAFNSKDEVINRKWEDEAKNVSANPKGLFSLALDATKVGGLVATMAATGNATGLGSVPNTILTFGGESIKHNREKYPDSPIKATVGAGLETLMYSLLAKDIFQTKNLQKIFSKTQPEIESITEKLTSGAITNESARQEMQTAYKKALDFAKGTLGKTVKITGELEGIKGIVRGFDRLNMTDEEFKKYHPDEEINPVHTFLTNLAIGGLGKFGESKAKEREFTETIYNAASNPKQAERIIDEVATTEKEAQELKANLNHAVKVKENLQEKGFSEEAQKIFVFQSLKEKVANERAEKLTDPTLVKKEKDIAKEAHEVKEQILAGKEPDEIVTTEQQKRIEEQEKAKKEIEVLEKNKEIDNKEIDVKIKNLEKKDNPLYQVQKERLEQQRKEYNDYYDSKIAKLKPTQDVPQEKVQDIQTPTQEKTKEVTEPSTLSGSEIDIQKQSGKKIYHGTSHEGELDRENDGIIWFTDDKKIADQYRKRNIVQNEIDWDKMIDADEHILESQSGIDVVAEEQGINLNKGKVIEGRISPKKPLDLTEYNSNIDDIGEVWNDLHKKKLVDEKWEDIDEEFQQEMKEDYEGKAIWNLLEKEGVYDKARKNGYDAIIINDVGVDGKPHISYGLFGVKNFESVPQEQKPSTVTEQGKEEKVELPKGDEKKHFAFSNFQRGSIPYTEKEILTSLKENSRKEDINALGYMELENLLDKVDKKMPKDIVGRHLFDKINAVVVNENGIAVIKLIDKNTDKISDKVFYKFKSIEDAAKKLHDVKEGHRKLNLETLASIESRGKETELTKYADPTVVKNTLEALGIEVPKSILDKISSNKAEANEPTTIPENNTSNKQSNKPTEEGIGTFETPPEPPKGTEPPKEEAVGGGEDGKRGITHEATQETTRKVGLPDYEKPETVTNESRIAKAKESIKENPNLHNEIMEKVEKGGRLTEDDNAVLAVYKNALDAELEAKPSKELYDQVSRLSKVLNPEGSFAGSLLQSRKLIDDGEGSLSSFLMGKEAAQGFPLSEKQVKEEAAKFQELKDAKEKLEIELENEKKKNAELVAQLGINKAKAAIKKAAKKSDAEYREERKKSVEAAREALKKIRTGEAGVQARVPLLNELTAIAPHVKDFMKSLIEQGVDKLDNIVTDIHAEFKDVLDGLSKAHVLDIIAGQYDTPKKQQTRNEKANAARLLQREAKLLRELNAERKGLEKKKGTPKERETTPRIEELKKKIKEVRELNKKNDIDESPEDLSIGEGELNAKREKELQKKAEKLLDDIRNKRFSEEEKKQPVFPKSRKVQALEDKVIDLENKIRHERSREEYEKRSKWRKGFDKVMEVLGIRRLVQSAVDISVPFRQGATLLSPRRIDIWAKAFAANLRSVFSPNKFDRINYAIRKDPQYHDMVKDGVVFNDLGSADPDLHNEDFRKSFIYKIPIISEPLKASNRSADGFLNVARYEMYKKMRRVLEMKGLTRESDPEAFKFIGNWTMNMTGRGKMNKIFEGKNMNTVLGNTFYGARLMASRFNLLNPVTYFDPRVPREAKVEAMKDMAAWVTTTMAIGAALAYGTGAKVSLNPDDSDFLQLRYDDKVYDISGGLANYARTFLRIAKAGYTKATGTKYEGNKATEKAGTSIVRFFRNKLSPNTSYGVDAFFGAPYPREFDPTDIVKIYPMYTDDVLKALKDEGVTSLATVLLPNIVGIGYGSYASKGQIDANLEDLKQRNMRSDEMNMEDIKNYNEGGRKITEKEFDQFTKERDKLIEDGLTKLFKEGAYVIDDNDQVVHKDYKELSKADVVKETNSIKAKATKSAKEKLFGKEEKTPERLDAEKELEEIKQEQNEQ